MEGTPGTSSIRPWPKADTGCRADRPSRASSASAGGVRNQTNRPNLSVETILAWADAHRERTGKYPNAGSGPILDAPGETWSGVDAALSKSGRGLTVRTRLVQLLAAERGRQNHRGKPRLTRREILTWADAHRQRTGTWPTADSGPIFESPGDTWCAVETALRDGCRGLPGGSSLAKLLARYRKKRNQKGLPDLVMKRIVAWAEAHFERTGEWPDAQSGPIPEAPGETWNGVQNALRRGTRGLPRRSSLAQLLARKRNVRNIRDRPPLTELQVLRWADAYYQKHGRWPSNKSGLIPGTARETWNTVDKALVKGDRGVPGGSSLARFLEEHRGKRHGKRPPPLLPEAIRAWALAHRQATGRWPSQHSGPVAGVPGENWGAIDSALREGRRGLPGGSSLPRFLSNEPATQS